MEIPDFTEGQILLIDKPHSWTSFDAVKKLKGGLKVKKIGHAGTLDPLATGLLIICTGKMTKRIDELQAKEKEYTGELILGKTTPSIDLETEFDSETDISQLKIEHIKSSIRQFLGSIVQVPPIYSAIKVDGQRVYKKARKGEDVVIKPRKVFIKEFILTDIQLPSVRFKIVCSKGTYIRSIVRDFGQVLNVGAVMTELKRTRIGPYSLNDALSPIDYISKYKMPEEVKD